MATILHSHPHYGSLGWSTRMPLQNTALESPGPQSCLCMQGELPTSIRQTVCPSPSPTAFWPPRSCQFHFLRLTCSICKRQEEIPTSQLAGRTQLNQACKQKKFATVTWCLSYSGGRRGAPTPLTPAHPERALEGTREMRSDWVTGRKANPMCQSIKEISSLQSGQAEAGRECRTISSSREH